METNNYTKYSYCDRMITGVIKGDYDAAIDSDGPLYKELIYKDLIGRQNSNCKIKFTCWRFGCSPDKTIESLIRTLVIKFKGVKRI